MADMDKKEQEETKAGVRERIVRAQAMQDLDTRVVAALSVLCDRLVAADPANRAFVEEMVAIADREAMGPGDNIPWISLSKFLSEA